jgi:hypothetical protein
MYTVQLLCEIYLVNGLILLPGLTERSCLHLCPAILAPSKEAKNNNNNVACDLEDRSHRTL